MRILSERAVTQVVAADGVAKKGVMKASVCGRP
jgi:hypothetical protein